MSVGKLQKSLLDISDRESELWGTEGTGTFQYQQQKILPRWRPSNSSKTEGANVIKQDCVMDEMYIALFHAKFQVTCKKKIKPAGIQKSATHLLKIITANTL